MEVDPPSDVAPPPSHLLGFSTLGACEKKEPMAGLPEPLPRPNKDLFSQDISVKMASELLFKLSEKVSKANENKDSTSFGMTSPFLDDRFRQSPFSTRSKSSSPAEASSSARTSQLQAGPLWSSQVPLLWLADYKSLARCQAPELQEAPCPYACPARRPWRWAAVLRVPPPPSLLAPLAEDCPNSPTLIHSFGFLELLWATVHSHVLGRVPGRRPSGSASKASASAL
ncbi:zinc finger protein 827 isoform X1 [Tachysurus ichikawai]